MSNMKFCSFFIFKILIKFLLSGKIIYKTFYIIFIKTNTLFGKISFHMAVLILILVGLLNLKHIIVNSQTMFIQNMRVFLAIIVMICQKALQ